MQCLSEGYISNKLAENCLDFMNSRSLNNLLGNVEIFSIRINYFPRSESRGFITSFFSISPLVKYLIIVIGIEKGLRIEHAVIIRIQRVLSCATHCPLAHFLLLLSVSLNCVDSLRVPYILFTCVGSFILPSLI